MVIADSSVFIDLLRRNRTRQVIRLEESVLGEVGIPDLVLYEVLDGVRPTSDLARVRARLLRFPVFATGGRDLALKAVENSHALRRLGIQVEIVDCLIATFCIEEGHSLLTSDTDFAPFAQHLGLVLL